MRPRTTCQSCSSPPISGASRCKNCRDKRRKSPEKECKLCGDLFRHRSHFCETCRELGTSRQLRKRAGLCRECGKKTDEALRCQHCAACHRKKVSESSKTPESRARIAEYQRTRKQNDIHFRLSCNLRTRLWQALKNNQKTGSAVRDLGCSLEELKSHLEYQFQEGMSWDNQGEWHVDHKRPLVSFDLTDRRQLLEACHYTNLQPLWAEENLSKGASC